MIIMQFLLLVGHSQTFELWAKHEVSFFGKIAGRIVTIMDQNFSRAYAFGRRLLLFHRRRPSPLERELLGCKSCTVAPYVQELNSGRRYRW